MDFLHAGRGRFRDIEMNVRFSPELAAVAAGQRNRDHGPRLCRHEGRLDVSRLAAGRDAKRHVSRVAERLDLPHKDMHVSVVVRYCGDDGWIGREGHSG